MPDGLREIGLSCPAHERGIDFEGLTASLKRCPDTTWPTYGIAEAMPRYDSPVLQHSVQPLLAGASIREML